MDQHAVSSTEGQANIARARTTLVPGDVVLGHVNDGDTILLIVENDAGYRTCKHIGNPAPNLHQYQLHNDWIKIGHIDDWKEMVKP